MKYIICALAFVAVASAQSTIDFCAVKASFCSGRDHIACNPNNFVVSGLSSNIQMIDLTQAQKDAIVAAHNNYRNQVAGGQTNTTFPTATKLSEMKWDDTLAYVAGVHAAYGEFKHDSCRATPAYRYSGQNLFRIMSSADTLDVDYSLAMGSRLWFEEIYIGNTSLVDRFETSHLPAGHFSVMVSDKSNHVGCAASKFNYLYGTQTWYAIMLTCNYEYTNMLNGATYAKGSTASACPNGISATYPNLCAAV